LDETVPQTFRKTPKKQTKITQNQESINKDRKNPLHKKQIIQQDVSTELEKKFQQLKM